MQTRASIAGLLLSVFWGAATPGVARAAPLSPITKGPYLQDLGPTTVVVRVEVDPPAAVDVEVSAVGADGGSAAPVVKHDASVDALHSVTLDSLKPASRYTYRVKVSGARSAEGTFTTAPADDSGAPFSFLIYGDDRTGDEAHASIVHSLLEVPSDFLVHTGDFVEDGSAKALWQTFFDIEAPLLRDRCLFACVGNHELVEPGGLSFVHYFASAGADKLYRSFRWSSARFFVLNGMDTWATSTEKDWLRDELTKADSEPGLLWRVVVVHFGPWSSGPHGKNVRMLGAGIVPMLIEHKVDLVVSGHDHIYERGEQDGLRYLVTGGGGAPLYRIEKTLPSTRKAESSFHYVKASVTRDAFELATTRADGSVLERCGFKRSTRGWDCDPGTVAPSPASPAPDLRAASSEAPPSSPSRCGCELVGKTAAPGGPVLGVLLGFGIALTELRRGRSRRG